MWLIAGGVGPALVGLPGTWAGGALASAAQRWFQRLRHAGELSRLVKAATGSPADLTDAEFGAVRCLLEDQQTWVLAAPGTLEDVAARISSCLPSRDGRTAEGSLIAARSIARGLLEFAVAELDPELFRQVLVARLQRMATSQADALDEAMLGVQADLMAGCAGLAEQLDQFLDRLPPGPAQRVVVAMYLRVLIDWLGSDPWPRDRRFDGPELTPAVIERKLRLSIEDAAGERDIEADELTRQRQRLVIVGAPGSGKTWLARRTARRCAADALEVLAAGGNLDEVELPLYTTCAHLFSAVGDIREAVVSSALGQLGDLGGPALSAAIRGLFTERNTPVLLVIDSLDEAHGGDERLRQAGTLPWRIVLTGRPGSWKGQLASCNECELLPLRYPDDVEPLIARWFEGRPARGHDLAAQIAERPGLQQAATVPLILAFYCIIGGGEPLPDFRCDLYARVLKRILSGRGRGGDDCRPDAQARLRTLRAWAWSGATSDPLSGVGRWADDIPTEDGQLADDDAVYHIAAPLGPPDVDTGRTRRRFIHRSIREHLVADHVARLPVDQAARALLPHIWYDPDWKYTAPAAIAMHPERDQVLRDLICRAAGSGQLPGDLAVIDAGWQVRGLLARVASQSRESDWSPQMAAVISQARLELARSAKVDDLDVATTWATSNRQASDALLALLAGESGYYCDDAEVADAVARLATTAEDKRQARGTLLALLRQADGPAAQRLADMVMRLGPSAEEERQARDALLAQPPQADGPDSWWLTRDLAAGSRTDGDKRQARDALLKLMAHQDDGLYAGFLAKNLAGLDPTDEDRHQARDALLALPTGEMDTAELEELAGGVTQLATTDEDKRQARHVLLALLAQQADCRLAGWLAIMMSRLDPTAQDKRLTRHALLGLLAQQADRWVADWSTADWSAAVWLAGGMATLDPTDEDKRLVRHVLLALLARQNDGFRAGSLAARVAALDPTDQDTRQARRWLLALLVHGSGTEDLVHGIVQLGPTDMDKRQARSTLLARLADGSASGALVDGQLDLTDDDKRQARHELLVQLTRQTELMGARWLASLIVELDPTDEDRRQAHDALFALLAHPTDTFNDGFAMDPVMRDVLVQLNPTARDLSAWRQWASRPGCALVAAARGNTALADWLEALPSLTSIDPAC